MTLRAYQAWEAGGGIAWNNLQKLAAFHGVTCDFIENGDELPAAEGQLDRIEGKLDEILKSLRALEVRDLFETPTAARESVLGEQRESPGLRGA